MAPKSPLLFPGKFQKSTLGAPAGSGLIENSCQFFSELFGEKGKLLDPSCYFTLFLVSVFFLSLSAQVARKTCKPGLVEELELCRRIQEVLAQKILGFGQRPRMTPLVEMPRLMAKLPGTFFFLCRFSSCGARGHVQHFGFGTSVCHSEGSGVVCLFHCSLRSLLARGLGQLLPPFVLNLVPHAASNETFFFSALVSAALKPPRTRTHTRKPRSHGQVPRRSKACARDALRVTRVGDRGAWIWGVWETKRNVHEGGATQPAGDT